jgi:hypothetical protein
MNWQAIIEWICRVLLATCFLGTCSFFGLALFHAISTHNNDQDP